MTKNYVQDYIKREDPHTDDYVEEFLKKYKINKISPKKGFVKLVKIISEIPWGEGRTIEDILKTKKIGTCTGKHLLLQACLEKLGIKSKQVVCIFRWSEQDIDLPTNLIKILQEGEWNHGHNFLNVEIDGNYIDIDVTWNSKLKKYGFLTLPSNWDGNSSFVGLKFKKRFDDTDMNKMKIELINSLTPEQQERRHKFVKELAKWIESINS